MIVNLKQKTLRQGLTGNAGRIVLGGGGNAIIVVALGIWIAWGAVIGGVFLSDFQLAIEMVASFSAFAYLVAGWKSRLILDFDARTYLHEYGLPPFFRRRRGYLDEFDHLSLTREVTSGFKGMSTFWKLTLTPKEGAQASLPGNATAVATAPIVLMFSGASDPFIVFSQDLSQAAALPLRDASQQIAPPPRTPGKAGWGCLLFAVGVIGLSNAYNLYESRGARFPVRPGTLLLINHRMGACTVHSLEVTAGPSHMETGSDGDPPHPTRFVVTPYSITLDIENTGSTLSTLNFTIGFDARARTNGSSGPLKPHAHSRVTVELTKIGNPPDDLFLRADG